MQNVTLYQTGTIRRNRNSNTIVFFSDLAFSDLQPFQKLQFLIGDFCFSFNTELGFLLDQLSQQLSGKMIKEWAILIESCVDDQELA
jgi:hypothetical protein